MTRRISTENLQLWAEFFCRCVEWWNLRCAFFFLHSFTRHLFPVCNLAEKSRGAVYAMPAVRDCLCMDVFYRVVCRRTRAAFNCVYVWYNVCRMNVHGVRAANVDAVCVCACHTLRDSTYSRIICSVGRSHGVLCVHWTWLCTRER